MHKMFALERSDKEKREMVTKELTSGGWKFSNRSLAGMLQLDEKLVRTIRGELEQDGVIPKETTRLIRRNGKILTQTINSVKEDRNKFVEENAPDKLKSQIDVLGIKKVYSLTKELVKAADDIKEQIMAWGIFDLTIVELIVSNQDSELIKKALKWGIIPYGDILISISTSNKHGASLDEWIAYLNNPNSNFYSNWERHFEESINARKIPVLVVNYNEINSTVELQVPDVYQWIIGTVTSI